MFARERFSVVVAVDDNVVVVVVAKMALLAWPKTFWTFHLKHFVNFGSRRG
jgi:hypothetical protein